MGNELNWFDRSLFAATIVIAGLHGIGWKVMRSEFAFFSMGLEANSRSGELRLLLGLALFVLLCATIWCAWNAVLVVRTRSPAVPPTPVESRWLGRLRRWTWLIALVVLTSHGLVIGFAYAVALEFAAHGHPG